MKSLKERLEEKIKVLYEEYDLLHAEHLDDSEKIAFNAGAASLVPLVLELAAALKLAEGYMFEATQPNKGALFGEFDDNNRKALQSIEKFLEKK